MRKLPTWKKLVFGMVATVGLLGICELVLRIVGYHGATSDPFESFVLHLPLFEPDGDEMRTRPSRTSSFHEQRFLRKKPATLIRIGAFGGSATYGVLLPDPRYGNYAQRLADEVTDGHPEIRAEAINCGGMCYASYRLVGIVEEALGYDLDIVIVMSGNNEFLEPRHYGKLMSEDSIRRVKDREANVGPPIWYRLRLGQLIATLIEWARPETASPSGDMVALGEMIPEMYIVRDEEERRLTLAHYARNLNRMADLCEEKGVPIVLCTVPTNLRDFSPFHTEPWAGISVEQARRQLSRVVDLFGAERYEECLAACRKVLVLDERAAALHFMAAKALEKLGRNEEAKEHFVKARDHDAFPHRATSEFNEKIREIARRRSLPLYDAEREFGNASPIGTPGKSLFDDQCHPNQVGHDMIAAGLAAIIDPLLFP